MNPVPLGFLVTSSVKPVDAFKIPTSTNLVAVAPKVIELMIPLEVVYTSLAVPTRAKSLNAIIYNFSVPATKNSFPQGLVYVNIDEHAIFNFNIFYIEG